MSGLARRQLRARKAAGSGCWAASPRGRLLWAGCRCLVASPCSRPRWLTEGAWRHPLGSVVAAAAKRWRGLLEASALTSTARSCSVRAEFTFLTSSSARLSTSLLVEAHTGVARPCLPPAPLPTGSQTTFEDYLMRLRCFWAFLDTAQLAVQTVAEFDIAFSGSCGRSYPDGEGAKAGGRLRAAAARWAPPHRATGVLVTQRLANTLHYQLRLGGACRDLAGNQRSALRVLIRVGVPPQRAP